VCRSPSSAAGRQRGTRRFGLANAETKAPVTDDSVFEAASLSKPVFAYAVLSLVDAGQIDLDTAGRSRGTCPAGTTWATTRGST